MATKKGWTAPLVLAVMVAIVGGLALLGQLQALEGQQAVRRQQAQAYATATAYGTVAAAQYAAQQAVQQTETVKLQATADSLVATNEARRAAAGAIVFATETAMAGRR